MMILRPQTVAFVAILLTAIGLLPSAPAGAVSPQELDWCKNMSDAYSPDLRIQGCTAAIQSGQWSGKNLAWAFIDRCFGYFIKRDYDSAVADCNQAIQLDPTNAYSYELGGTAYRGKGDYDSAIKAFDRAIVLDPKNSYPYELRGTAYLSKDDYDNAIRDFDKAIMLNPKDAAAFFNRGNAERAKGDTVGGDADIAHAHQLQPAIGE